MMDVEGSEAKVEEVSFREENYTFDFTQTGLIQKLFRSLCTASLK